MGKLIDLTNQTFGRLLVIERDYEKQGESSKVYWKCLCNCMEEKFVSVRMDALRNGRTTSCGCYHKDVASKKSTNKKYNEYQIIGATTVIFTSDNNYIYIDTEEYDKIAKYCWSITENGYAQARDCDNDSLVLMHRVIMNAQKGEVVDHKYHDTLDNRKINLRLCTQKNNMANQVLSKANTSGHKGVYWNESKGGWDAKIGYQNKSIHLGRFVDMKEAIKIRLEAEIKYFGEYRNIIDYINEYKIEEENSEYAS